MTELDVTDAPDPSGSLEPDESPNVDSPVEPSTTFEAFYGARYPGLVRLAWSLVDTREEAEEVVQDAFAATYRRYASMRNPEAYVRSCVLNGCRQVLRRRIVRRRKPLDAPPPHVVDAHDELFDVIRTLPVRQQMVVVLRYQHGLGDHEIAKAMGVPVGTVKSALSRAKDRLRKELS